MGDRDETTSETIIDFGGLKLKGDKAKLAKIPMLLALLVGSGGGGSAMLGFDPFGHKETAAATQFSSVALTQHFIQQIGEKDTIIAETLTAVHYWKAKHEEGCE